MPNLNNGKHYLASIGGGKDFLQIMIVDEKIKKTIDFLQLSSIKEMKKSLLKYKSMLKAAFVDVIMCSYPGYNTYEFAKEIKNFLDLYSIPCHFSSFEYWISFTLFVAANITPYLNDDTMVVNVTADKIFMGFHRFTINGYEIFNHQVMRFERLESIASSFSQIMKECNFKKMILYSQEKNLTMLKNFEKLLRSNKTIDINDKLIVISTLEIVDTQGSGKAIIEMSKWFFDRSYNKFHLIPQIPRPIEVLGVIGDSQKKLLLAGCEEAIPFTKSVIINKSVQTCLMIQHFSPGKEAIIQTLLLDQKCHQRKLTFTIESECFPEIKIEPIIFPEIECLRKKLDELEIQIPVIGFFRNSSVICVPGKNGYKFLDSWNGKFFVTYKNTDYTVMNFSLISKKIFGMSAIKTNETKMSFVVYDLIKIMSMPADKITVNESWKFTFTKDAENPILIEFDNFDGNRKLASSPFLMAMLLKEKIKLIKKEMKMNEKPKEIGFCFFDKMSDVEKKRIESGLEEACEMLKIKCKFITFN